MTATLSVVRVAADSGLDGFRLGYVAEDGTQHWLSLAATDIAEHALTALQPSTMARCAVRTT